MFIHLNMIFKKNQKKYPRGLQGYFVTYSVRTGKGSMRDLLYNYFFAVAFAVRCDLDHVHSGFNAFT